MNQARSFVILLADDDAGDRRLALDALEEAGVSSQVRCVQNGEEVMDYLYRRGAYALPEVAPLPDLVLLDLNMPRKDGREVLQEIKADPNLRRIPVVIFTTSRAEEDIDSLYDLGANSFLSKPPSYDGLVELMRTLGHYWIELAAVPGAPN